MIALDRDFRLPWFWEVNAAAPTDPVTGTPHRRCRVFSGAPLARQDARRQGNWF